MDHASGHEYAFEYDVMATPGHRDDASMTGKSTMSVMDILKSEHELIMLGLAVMESICRRHDSGEALDPAAFERLVGFFREFADRLHHAKEEDILFRAMDREKVHDEHDLIGSLTADHTLGRIFLGSMDESIAQIRANDPDAADDLVESARCYLTLLAHHICRENNHLCELVEKELAPDRLNALADEFVQSELIKFPPGTRAEHEKTVASLRAEYGLAEDILKLCPGT